MKITAVGHIRNISPVVFGYHSFEAVNGEIRHEIDGALVATVPPAGFEPYAQEYPDCVPVIQFIQGPVIQGVDMSAIIDPEKIVFDADSQITENLVSESSPASPAGTDQPA